MFDRYFPRGDVHAMTASDVVFAARGNPELMVGVLAHEIGHHVRYPATLATQVKALLNSNRVDLARTTIVAPIDGVVVDRKINPGKVFDLTLPLDQVAEGYRAMDERRAIKALLRP